jgi:hypothetical protein
MGSGADPQGAARGGAGWGVRGSSRLQLGPGFPEWDPVSRNGTHNQQLGPAIDYSNLLGLKVCFPQLNVSPAILAIIPRQFQFSIAHPQLQRAIQPTGPAQ